MVDRREAVRRFFRIESLAVLALALAGCVGGGSDWSPSEPAAAGVERAEKWREQGLSAVAAHQFEESARLYAEQDDTAQEIESLFCAAECWLLDGRPSVAEVDVDNGGRRIAALPIASSKQRFARLRHACLEGDLEFVRGSSARARTHYEDALGDALGRERDAVAMRLSLLAEKCGDKARARSLANGLIDPNAPRIVELRRMLLPSRGTASAPSGTAAVTAKAAPARPEAVAASGPPVLPRTAWGARRPRPNLDRMTKIWRITVHHTATRLAGSSSRVAADAIKKFQRQHQDEKGWADIGYHYVIDPSGRIWEGRPLTWQGAHAGTPELNVGNIGVALIGDFTLQQPTASQKKSMADLLDSLCSRYHVDRSHVFTHKEIRPDPTECPGPALQRAVDAWRRQGLSGSP